MTKISTSFILLFFFGVAISNTFAAPVINGLPSTLIVGDTITVYASGGTAPYSWWSDNPAAISVTQLNSTDAQIIVHQVHPGVQITVDDDNNDSAFQIVSSYLFRIQIPDMYFIDGDTVEVPLYYKERSPALSFLAADISVRYDTTMFTFIGFNKIGSITNSMSVISNQVYDTIKLGVASTNEILEAEDVVFINLKFISKETVSSSVSSILEITKFEMNEEFYGLMIGGELTVDPIPNSAPVFTQYFEADTSDENALNIFTFIANDTNGDTVKYFLTMNPAPSNEATIDSLTGVFSFSPSFESAGQYLFEVTADDGNGGVTSHQFTIVVNNVNRDPYFTSFPSDTVFIMEQEHYQETVIANDPDISTVYFSLVNAPAGMTMDTVTGFLEWTPSFVQSGIYTVTINARDNEGGEVDQQIVFAVIDSNRVPYFVQVPNDTTIYEGDPYIASIVAQDDDLDDIRYYVQSGEPGGFLLDTLSGAISWTPTNAQQGIYNISLIVSDNKDYGNAVHNFTITVENVNLSPAISTSFPDTIFITENQIFSLDIDANDADGDSIKYYMIDAPAGMTIDSLTGLVEWTPDFTQSGYYHPTFKAFDSLGAFDSKYVVIAVVNVNRLPVFTATLPDTTISEGQLLQFMFTANDPDFDALTFYLHSSNVGASVSPAGFLQWTPSYTQAGIETVIVRVQDIDDFVLDTILVTITNTNIPPFFTSSMNDTIIARFDTLQFQYEGFDPDSQFVFFSLLMSPSGAVITPAGSLQWIPPTEALGEYIFIVQVSDSTTITNDTVKVRVNRFGDVSGNGNITSFDAGLILRDQAEIIQLTDFQQRIGNVSGDTSFTSFDASLILQYVVGLIDTFPGGLGKRMKQEAILSAFSFRIIPSQINGEYDLFVSINKPSNVYGVTMNLGFDSSLVVPKSLVQTSLTDSMMVSTFVNKGKANIALAGVRPLNTAGDIARLTFSLKQNNVSGDVVLFTMKKFFLNETDFTNDIGGITLNVKNDALLPNSYLLEQNYPNPFNPSTLINYQLPKESKVTIIIYNMIGQIVKTLISEEQSAGYYSIEWNGTDNTNATVSSGVYLYKIVAQSEGKNVFVSTKKMLLIK